MAGDISADDILDCALGLADESAWETVRLHQVARRLGVGLDTVQRHFAEKEDIVDAWFDRADTVSANSQRTRNLLRRKLHLLSRLPWASPT